MKRQLDSNEASPNKKAKASGPPGWIDHGDDVMVYDAGETSGSASVVGFDMDWTLIRTKSGKTFPQNADDWEFWHASVKPMLQEAAKDSKLVIFSNQKLTAKNRIQDVQKKIKNLISRLEVPMQAFISTGGSKNRKPRVGMWTIMEKHYNGGVTVDLSRSMYVGDAAGRPAEGTHKKDFAASDYKFAMNVGVAFRTPEAYFLKSTHPLHSNPAKWSIGFDPKTLLSNDPPFEVKPSDTQEVLIMVGPPACGKSTLARQLPSYTRINQDTLKTPAKCLAAAKEALQFGKSVIIDNTNSSKKNRAPYISEAKKQKIPVRCVWWKDHPKELSMHLNEVRGCQDVSGENSDPDGGRRVPTVAIHTFYKNTEPPTTQEGITEILHAKFVPDTKDEAAKKLLFSFLT